MGVNKTETFYSTPAPKHLVNSALLPDSRRTDQNPVKTALFNDPLQATQTKTKTYQGAVGRPSDALESIMVSQSVPHEPFIASKDEKERAAQIILRCQKYWTAPRMRARHYDPTHPNQPKCKPGMTRLPGYELSTREGIALHYLMENGRLADLLRSLEQLRERGAILTEQSYLPLLAHAKRLGEASMACALLIHMEKTETWTTARSYDAVIDTLIGDDEVDLAEAVTTKALKRNLRPANDVLCRMAALGSHTPAQWQAKWGLQALRSKQEEATNSIDRESVGIFIVRGNAPNREILCDTSRMVAVISPPVTSFSGVEMSTKECLAHLKCGTQELHLGNELDSMLQQVLEKNPHGHAYAQIRCNQSAGQHPVSNPQPSYLSPKDVWTSIRPDETPSLRMMHARTWLLQISVDIDPKKGVWLPIDEALYTLMQADRLKQWGGY